MDGSKAPVFHRRACSCLTGLTGSETKQVEQLNLDRCDGGFL